MSHSLKIERRSTAANVRALAAPGPRSVLVLTGGRLAVIAADDVFGLAADAGCRLLASAQLSLYRTRSTTAIVTAAVRMAAAGRLGRFTGGYRSGPLSLVESQVDDTDFPDRSDDDLQAALAGRLLAIATTTSHAAWD